LGRCPLRDLLSNPDMISNICLQYKWLVHDS
jgi:hypothetical protein